MVLELLQQGLDRLVDFFKRAKLGAKTWFPLGTKKRNLIFDLVIGVENVYLGAGIGWTWKKNLVGITRIGLRFPRKGSI